MAEPELEPGSESFNEKFTSGSVQQITHEVLSQAPRRDNALPYQWVPISSGTPTPDVINVERLILNNKSPINVTNFLHAQNGQHIIVLGDGFSTVPGAGNIRTNTGTALKLLANVAYHFTNFNGIWYQSSS